MLPTKNGSMRLFQVAGITVFLHWSWFVIALYQITNPRTHYSSIFWNILEYLALFLIVLTHEFGHSLACRQVGGRADQIVLWPLGGVAYVDPPQRPGPTLWSITAGPLVNVILVPILSALLLLTRSSWGASIPDDAANFISNIWWINTVLLIFNILPIYPLDGGQILRSLLWFPLGRARSLYIASIIGFVGVVGFIGLAVIMKSIWLGILCFFILMNCWRGLAEARMLSKVDKLPRRQGFSCPKCHTSPPVGEFWTCGNCSTPFDMFQTVGVCPRCGAQYHETPCLDCGTRSGVNQWLHAPPIVPR